MPKPFDLVNCFSFYVGDVGRVTGHHGASEHKVLPHQQPGGIAEMVKLFTGIEAPPQTLTMFMLASTALWSRTARLRCCAP